MPECQLQRKVKIPNRLQPINQALIRRAGFGHHYLNSAAITLYSIIENLVLWARSEITGFATIECPGVMEYWNTGILGLAE